MEFMSSLIQLSIKDSEHHLFLLIEVVCAGTREQSSSTMQIILSDGDGQGIGLISILFPRNAATSF